MCSYEGNKEIELNWIYIYNYTKYLFEHVNYVKYLLFYMKYIQEHSMAIYHMQWDQTRSVFEKDWRSLEVWSLVYKWYPLIVRL